MRITEKQLNRIIKESVKKILNEYAGYDSEKFAYGEQPLYTAIQHAEHTSELKNRRKGIINKQALKKGEERKEASYNNLDPLRLRQQNNPYHDYKKNYDKANEILKQGRDELKHKLVNTKYAL